MARKSKQQIDLDQLPPHLSSAIEAAIEGQDVAVSRSGVPPGSLEFSSLVQDGVVLPAKAAPVAPDPRPAGVTVVVTAMELSDTARAKLAAEFGEGFPFWTSMALRPPPTFSWCRQRALS